MGMKPRKAREPRGYTVAATVLDYCRTHGTFTRDEIATDIGRIWAMADGPFRTLGKLRKRELVKYEYSRQEQTYRVLWCSEAPR